MSPPHPRHTSSPPSPGMDACPPSEASGQPAPVPQSRARPLPAQGTQAVAEPGTAVSRKGPLRPLETATAAVLGGVAVILVVAGWFVPHTNVVTALGAVPLAVVAQRHRLRALVAATCAASLVGFLVAGMGPVSEIFICAMVGGLVGVAKRLRRGLPAAVAMACLVGPVLAGASDLGLALFSKIRALTLEQVRNTWRGLAQILRRFPALEPSLHELSKVVELCLRYWWITIGAGVIVYVLVATVITWVLVGPVLDRLARVVAEDRLERAALVDRSSGGVPAPLPLELVEVTYRYRSSRRDALHEVSMELRLGEYLAVVGQNGSGKSTLGRLLAGQEPLDGRVIRPGRVGLGEPGGTAIVFQRPETQVLGVRVADDVVWGLGDNRDVDISGLLGAVGLAGMEKRETSTLSGGELQRLALASALARRPRLLISDESTAMVDSSGRRALTELLSALPHSAKMSVVHVTHRPEEAQAADRLLRLEAGRVLQATSGPIPPPGEAHAAASQRWAQALPPPRGRPVIELVGVHHTYAEGTPWAQPALSGVSLTIPMGSGLLVVGGNGSGKSTLAWVMAGLLDPSGGYALVDGRPAVEVVGEVGLAFQHSRLQVQRSTVRSEVCAAAGVGAHAAEAALASVGLDPRELGDSNVDQLSGGQLRRVALAGLLARRPRVLILDEPLAGLDAPSRAGLLAVLARLRAGGLTLVVVSHDLEGTEEICDRVVRLERGRVVADGPLGLAEPSVSQQ